MANNQHIKELYDIDSKPKTRTIESLCDDGITTRLVNVIVFALLFAVILVFSTKSNAEEPRFAYDKPSNEMDFNIPALPSLSEKSDKNLDNLSVGSPPPPPKTSKAPKRDNFFSSADNFFTDDKVLNSLDDELQKGDKAKIDKKINKPIKKIKLKNNDKKTRGWWKKPRIRFVKRKEAPHKYRSQTLPETIYKRAYNKENRHLPAAWYQKDLHSAMELAVEKGDINTMRALNKDGFSPDMHTHYGEPLVVLAARFGRASSLEWLLAKNADVYAVGRDGLAAIHIAAYSGNEEILKILLDNGADPAQPDVRGLMPHDFASKGKNPTISTSLLQEYSIVQTASIEVNKL
jgi:hypothetical protein